MNEINLDSDEQKKLEDSQQLESLREKRKEKARKFRERRPHYSKDYYLAQHTGKGYTIKSNSKKDWIRETIMDPSERDNRVLIEEEKYGKKKDINILEIQAKHYCDFKAKLDQVNESDIDFSETHKIEAIATKKNVVKTGKKNKLVKEKPLKAVGPMTKSSRVSRKETPVKSEPDLGCFPQLPLLDVAKFKNIQLLLHKIDATGQVNNE